MEGQGEKREGEKDGGKARWEGKERQSNKGGAGQSTDRYMNGDGQRGREGGNVVGLKLSETTPSSARERKGEKNKPQGINL